MKRQRILIGILALGLLLALAVGMGQAQGPGTRSQTQLSPQVVVGTAFTYQGRLFSCSAWASF